jgi:AhpD family alkylhydroperoxidase
MQARMKSPGIVIPGAMTAIRSLNEAVQQGGVPQRTLDLVHLRTSQVNGCSVCLGAAVKARKDGETDERIFTLSAWRDTPYFSDPERAALALTEAVTRLSDRTDPVPDGDLGRSRQALRREAASRTGLVDRHRERLQPREHRHQASPRRIGPPKARTALPGAELTLSAHHFA